jgi:hypothetical protein
MITASIFSDFWNRLADHNEQGLFLVLVRFIGSFAFIRMSTRLMRSPKVPWWPGSVVSDSGVHLHHLVFGIVTMMAAGALGFAAFGESPWAEICALLFGIGAGLTIDEFALWVYLEDVYWAEEGRSSIDATVIAAAGMLLLLLGFSPLSFDTGSATAIIGSLLTALFLFSLVAICFAKQRVMHGTIGFFVFPIAIYGASRIGKPGSAWARRATASGGRISRSRPKPASRPTGAPSASRTPSATSSAGSPARASKRRATRPPPQPGRRPPRSVAAPNALPTSARAATTIDARVVVILPRRVG